MVSLVQFILLDEIDGALGEITALYTKWRHAKCPHKRPEGVSDTAPQIQEHDSFFGPSRYLSSLQGLTQLNELPRQVVPIFVEVCRVLLIKDVPVASSIKFKPLDPHLCQLWHTLIGDNLLSRTRHVLTPLVVAYHTVYLVFS